MPGKKNNEQTSKETNTVMCFLFGNFWLKVPNTNQEKDQTIFICIQHPPSNPTLRFSVGFLTLLISTFLRSTLVYSYFAKGSFPRQVSFCFS